MSIKKKTCSKCKRLLVANKIVFTVNNYEKSGLGGWCRECKRKSDRVYSRKYREEHPGWKREDNERNRVLINKLVKEYAKKYPERLKATSIVNYALKTGKLKREPCVICGKEFVHGHHPDYDKPLEVVWLCPKHHKAVHNNLINLKVKL